MTNDDLCKRLALGALAGLAGTFVMQALRTGGKKIAPGTEPPMRDDPGNAIVQKTKNALPQRIQERIPKKVETSAAASLAIGYGVTFGAVYAAVRPKGGATLRDGVALGVANWAIGYLGWLPASGIMPPVWRHEGKQIAMPIAQHAVYGAATVATYDWLLEHV